MGRLVISEFVSLDGVVENPPPGAPVGDFKHAGWSLQRGEGAEQFKLDEILDADALLLGRVTYEEFADLWPARDGDMADEFNRLPKYVVSSTLEDPEWKDSKVLSGDVVQEVSRLKRELDGDVVVYGSTRLARALIGHDLVDELRLMVYPVLLGSGERLFGETSDQKPLRLVDTRTFEDGITVLIYALTSGESTRCSETNQVSSSFVRSTSETRRSLEP